MSVRTRTTFPLTQYSSDRVRMLGLGLVLGLGFSLRAARVHTHHTFTQHANAM